MESNLNVILISVGIFSQQNITPPLKMMLIVYVSLQKNTVKCVIKERMTGVSVTMHLV